MPEAVLAQNDETLFDEAVGMLATLEQQRARAADRSGDPAGLQSLELIAEVTNALVGFVTARCSQSSVLPSRVAVKSTSCDRFSSAA